MPNLHPLIVHFPIALLTVAVLCELLACFRKSPRLNDAALIIAIAAAVGALLAVVTGLLASNTVPAISETRLAFESHATLGYLVLASALAFAALKLAGRLLNTDRFLMAQIIVGVAGVILTFMAAREGGELVYRHGVGVMNAERSRGTQPDTAGIDLGK